jgi:HlyD family secretion protein
MKRISFRKLLPWLVVAFIVSFAVYRVKFSPTPVTAYTVATGEVRGEVMGTGTLEARVKTVISHAFKSDWPRCSWIRATA